MDNSETLLVRALTEPILMGGIPREMAILNVTIHILFIQITQSLPCVIIAIFTYIGLYIAMRSATKKDADFFACFKRFVKHRKYYGV